MKTCMRCGRELPTRLDEYGPDLHAPLCVACWEATPEDSPDYVCPLCGGNGYITHWSTAYWAGASDEPCPRCAAERELGL